MRGSVRTKSQRNVGNVIGIPERLGRGGLGKSPSIMGGMDTLWNCIMGVLVGASEFDAGNRRGALMS